MANGFVIAVTFPSQSVYSISSRAVKTAATKARSPPSRTQSSARRGTSCSGCCDFSRPETVLLHSLRHPAMFDVGIQKDVTLGDIPQFLIKRNGIALRVQIQTCQTLLA